MQERYCPNCGSRIEETDGYCAVCGSRYITEENADTLILRCRMCGRGTMKPIDASSEHPLYVCSVCGAYYGEFLKTGKVIFYNTLHLKIGRIISTEIKLKNNFRVSVKKMKEGMVEEGISEIAKSLTVDLEGYGYQEVLDALYYLLEEGVISYWIDDMENTTDFCWFNIGMEVNNY